MLGDVEDRDRGAETSERLRHLAADGATTDDAEALRELGQREDRLVGEVVDVGEAGDRRGRGTRAGGDRGVTEPEALFADLEGVGGDEASFAEEDVDPDVAEA